MKPQISYVIAETAYNDMASAPALSTGSRDLSIKSLRYFRDRKTKQRIVLAKTSLKRRTGVKPATFSLTLFGK